MSTVTPSFSSRVPPGLLSNSDQAELLAHEIPTASSTFPLIKYDVTNICFQIWCCGRQMLYLEPEEVYFHSQGCIIDDKKRMPYGELQNVEQKSVCNLCHSFGGGSGLSNTNGSDGNDQGISPGFCGIGQGGYVTEIVNELKKRMRQRGDTANIRRQEEIAMKIDMVLERLVRIEERLGTTSPPGQMTMSTVGAANQA